MAEDLGLPIAETHTDSKVRGALREDDDAVGIAIRQAAGEMANYGKTAARDQEGQDKRRAGAKAKHGATELFRAKACFKRRTHGPPRVFEKSEAAIGGAGRGGFECPLPEGSGMFLAPLAAGRRRDQMLCDPDRHSTRERKHGSLPL